MIVYCINLDQRSDRWEYVQKEFEPFNFKLERFSAIKQNNGHNGCTISHNLLLDKLSNYDVFMIIEDDFKLCIDNPVEILNKAIKQLPNDWDMLYLGATLNEPLDRYSENLYILKKAWATHAIIYNNKRVVKYILDNREDEGKVDIFLSNDVQEKFNCFITYPMIATQNEGYSNILRNFTDYSEIEKRYKKYIKMKIAFMITTYNRPKSIKRLYESIKHLGDVYIVNDGGKIPNVPSLHKCHGGKSEYYLTVSFLWEQAKLGGIYDYYIMIPDDMIPVEGWLESAIETWDKIRDRNKICMNLYVDKLRYKKSCWTSIQTKDYGEYFQTGWVDMCFLAQREFFQLLNFSIAKPDRDFSDKKLGSGVGSVISHFFAGQKKNMYQVKNTLFLPQQEAYESQMNPYRKDNINETI